MASKTCTACASERRAEIDLAIVALASVRSIGREFGLSKDAVARHKKHVGAIVQVAAQAHGEDLGETLFQKINLMEQDLRRLAARAEHDGDVRAAIGAQSQLGDVVKLLHEITPVESGDRELTIRFLYACQAVCVCGRKCSNAGGGWRSPFDPAANGLYGGSASPAIAGPGATSQADFAVEESKPAPEVAS